MPSEPERSIREVACSTCRSKKVKCDKRSPICSKCMTNGLECIYVSHKKTGPKRRNANDENLGTKKSRNSKRLKPSSSFPEIFEEDTNNSSESVDTPVDKLLYNNTNNGYKFADYVFPLIEEASIPFPGKHVIVDPQISSYLTNLQKLQNATTQPSVSTGVEGGETFESHFQSLPLDVIKKKNKIFKEVGLTYQQVCKMHHLCFAGGLIRSILCKERYLKKFKRTPEKLKHLTYMILAFASSRFPSFQSKTDLIYEVGCKYIKECDYFSYSVLSSLNKRYDETDGNTLECSYLQSVSLKAVFEYRNGMNLDSAFTISCAVRLAQVLGYDRLDPPNSSRKEYSEAHNQETNTEAHNKVNNDCNVNPYTTGHVNAHPPATTTAEPAAATITTTRSSDLNSIGNTFFDDILTYETPYDNFLMLDREYLINELLPNEHVLETNSPYFNGPNPSFPIDSGSTDFAEDPPISHGTCSASYRSNISNEMSVMEEKRRVFWQIYCLDKYYSLVSGLPSALAVDSTSVIFTRLPSDSAVVEAQWRNNSSKGDGAIKEYYLHEAMKQLEHNEVLVDFSSSRILILAISENIIKWCKTFYFITKSQEFESLEVMDNLQAKVRNLVANFENLEKNLVSFEIESDNFIKLIFSNSFIILYQTVLKKFTSFLKITKDRSKLTYQHFEFYYYFIENCIRVSENAIRLILESEAIGLKVLCERVPYMVFFSNSLKSLFQVMSFLIQYRRMGLNYQLERVVPIASLPSSLSTDPNFDQLLSKLQSLANYLISELDKVPRKIPLLENSIKYFVACNDIIKEDGDVETISFFLHY